MNNTSELNKGNIVKHFLSHLEDVVLDEKVSIEYTSKLARDLYLVLDLISDEETLLKVSKELKTKKY